MLTVANSVIPAEALLRKRGLTTALCCKRIVLVIRFVGLKAG